MGGLDLSRRSKKPRHASPKYGFALTWLIMAAFLPIYKLWALLLTFAVSALVKFVLNSYASKKDKVDNYTEAEVKAEEPANPEPEKAKPEAKSYGPEVDAILAEGNRALSEMGRIYMSIKDVEIRKKINEIMRITDKITQDAIEDPSDIPQIKKFLNYYLPTTIKLLNAYDRMSAQGIEGENLDKSMKSITEMLDTVIVAYKKRLDSLFANQALDIETDIEVMNTMLAREGLAGDKDFYVQSSEQ